MRIITIAFGVISFFFLQNVFAQDSREVSRKSVYDDSLNFLIDRNDTVKWISPDSTVNFKSEEPGFKAKEFKPNPTKAVIYSAIFPGLGQIYNRKYWKLPLVYGGFLGISYALSWNGRYYNDYSDAYSAIMQDYPKAPENSSVWLPFLGQNADINNISDGDIERYRLTFKRRKDFYRRNRDLSIIGAVALYAVCMIDAYVDAQLFDFDISPDLSFKVEPTIINTGNNIATGNSLGVQFSFKF